MVRISWPPERQEEAALEKVSCRCEKAWTDMQLLELLPAPFLALEAAGLTPSFLSEAMAEKRWLQRSLQGEADLGFRLGCVKTRIAEILTCCYPALLGLFSHCQIGMAIFQLLLGCCEEGKKRPRQEILWDMLQCLGRSKPR